MGQPCPFFPDYDNRNPSEGDGDDTDRGNADPVSPVDVLPPSFDTDGSACGSSGIYFVTGF